MANPSIWDTLKDAFVVSAMHSPLGGGGLARAYYRARGYSNDQINRAIDAETSDLQGRHQNDHSFTGGATSLLGSILGGVDPTYAVGGAGKNVVRRVASQAAIQGAASVGRQAVEVGTGQRKRIDPAQVVRDANTGALFQAGGEATGKAVGAVVDAARNYIPKAFHAADVKIHGEYAPTAPDGMPGNASVPPMDPKTISDIMNDPEASGATGINDNVPSRRVNNRDLPDTITDEDLQGLPPANREYLQEKLGQEPPSQIKDEEVLTPAEAQEMDASAPKPVVDNTGYEAHTPYIEQPPVPANDMHDSEVVPMEAPKQQIPTEYEPPVQDPVSTPEEPLTSEGNKYKSFEEHPTDDPDGNKFLTYTTKAGDKLPIKMGIEPDGTAEIAIDQFGNGANKLGPAEIRSAMNDLMDMYPDIKRFGGFRRSGAGKGRVQEITPNRPTEAPEAAPEAAAETPNILTDERGGFTPWGKPKKAKLEDIPDEELTPEQRVIKGMNASEKIIPQQEQARRIELAKRFEIAKKQQYTSSGQAGFHQELSKLSGELPKLPSPYSIRPKLTNSEIDDLYNQVTNHPALSYTDSIHAREGLEKLMANSGADLPTRSELDALRKVFTEDPTSGKKSISSWISDVINAPRSIMASMDLSAPLRQGLPMIHRKEYWTAFGSMFKQIGQEGFDAVKQDIAARPSYHLMKDSGLALTDVDDVNLSHHEERFLSNLATKIPVFGHIVKGSERAYVGFLNKLRADTFDSLVKTAHAAGKDLTPKDIKDIAEYINTATGRGDLNGLVPKFLRGEEFDANKASPLLSGVLFSPRLMASRFQMLNPHYYYKLSPIAQKEAAKSLLSTVTFTTTALSIAHMAGLKVGIDPRSTDFGKIRMGRTTYDMTGGFSSYIRLITQVADAARVNPDGKKVAVNRADTIGHFVANKFSPPASEAYSLLKGVDSNYNKVDRKHLGNVLEDIGKDFVPLVAQDTYSVYNNDGAKQAAISAVPDTFGVGVNTFDDKPKASHKTKFDGFGKSGFGKSFKSGF